MNKLTLFFLAAILIILSLIALAPYLGSLLPPTRLSPPNSTFPIIDPESLTQITITFSDQSVTLTKSSDSWTVNDTYPVDSDLLNQLLTYLGDLHASSSNLVSSNPDKQATFNLTPETGISLTLTSPDLSHHLIIGEGTSPSTFFFRQQNQPQVYQGSGQILAVLEPSLSTWRSKVITTISPTQISQINITTPTGNLSLIKQSDNTWHATQPNRETALEELTSDRLLHALDPLTAATFAQDEQANQYLNLFPKSTFTVLDPDGQPLLTLSLAFHPDQQQWWAQTSASDQVFSLTTLTVNQLLLDPAEIFTQ